MGGSIAPVPFPYWFTNNGFPAVGYKIFTYDAGTSTKRPTYTDAALTSAHTNPIIVNSSGRTGSPIYLLPGVSYKFVYALNTDADPPLSPIWTADPINATEATALDVDIIGVAGETISAGQSVYLSDGSGGNTVGRWYRASSANTYSSTQANQIGFALINFGGAGATGAIRQAGRLDQFLGSGLTTGALYYIGVAAGNITSTPGVNPRPIAQADSTSSIVIGPWVPITDASLTNPGRVTITAQTFAGVKTFASPPIGAAFISRCTTALTKNNNTTLADVVGMAFPIAASEIWAFEFRIKGISSSTTAHWKFAVTGPAAPTAVWYGIDKGSNIAGDQAVAAFATAVPREAALAAGKDEYLIVAGYVRNGANAGTVQLQMAQNAAQAFDTIVRLESYVIAHRQA